jgi:hypothetical protein
MTKKNVLWVSGICGGVFIVLLVALLYNLCGQYRIFCKEIFGFIVYPFLPLPLIFLFSLITYKMREEIFRAWWNVARWFAPIITGVTLLQNVPSSGGGVAGVIGRGFDIFIIGILYTIWTVVSLVQIVRTRRMLKGKK